MNGVCSLAGTCDVGYFTTNSVCSLAVTSGVSYFVMNGVCSLELLPLMLVIL